MHTLLGDEAVCEITGRTALLAIYGERTICTACGGALHFAEVTVCQSSTRAV